MSPTPLAVLDAETLPIAPRNQGEPQSAPDFQPSTPNFSLEGTQAASISDLLLTEAPVDPPTDMPEPDVPPDIIALHTGPMYAAELRGMSNELIDGTREGHFARTTLLTVRLDDDENLVGIDIPGFAQLPMLYVDLAPAGEPRTYSGEPRAEDGESPFESYSIIVTFREIELLEDSATLIADLDVYAAGGSLVVTGSAVHILELTWGAAAVACDSSTTYDVLMAAGAPGIEGVELTALQELVFSGALLPQ
jgi:hypothetical protein